MNRDTLLIVDDAEISRTLLRMLFDQEYNILEAQNGEQALVLYRQYHDNLAAMLLDIIIPIKDGYQVLAEIQQSDLSDTVPIIVVTGDHSIENEMKVLELGAADIVTKPFEPHVIRRRVQNCVKLNEYKINLEEQVAAQADHLRESKEVLMDALSSVIEQRSVETGQHILRIRMFTKILLQDIMQDHPEYGLDDHKINVIASAASLHDIGKIAIPDAVLNKPGRLTAEEFELMKTHVVKGCEVLATLDRMNDLEYLGYAYHICRYHHERWDGNGYPDHLQGDQIPICAQVVGLADAYDALTTERPYKAALPPDIAANMILNGECGVFSPQILESFKRVSNEFAQLAHDYVDGKSPKLDEKALKDIDISHPYKAINSLQLSQQKYQAMLRYVGATVAELDIDTDVFHLVYQANSELDTLKLGGLFHTVFRSFVELSVHPDDRKEIYASNDLKEFADSGEMQRTRKYRVLNTATGRYVWFRVTALRIGSGEDGSHRVLLVWKALPGDGPQEQLADYIHTEHYGYLAGTCICRNDKWFTITSVNEGFTSMLGYTEQELDILFGRRYIEMIHPDDRSTVFHKLRAQMALSDRVELEYRLITRNGQWIWVMDRCLVTLDDDGKESLNSILIDITKTKAAQEELRLSLERYQIIMNQTNDIIFEWDIGRDTFSFTSNWQKTFHYDPFTEQASQSIMTHSHAHPQDVARVRKMMHEISSGQPYVEDEIRIADAEGKYRWFRIRATAQFDSEKRPIKAVGVILDIDGEKRRTQSLIDKAERDALTGLYNKSAAVRKVRLFLENRKRSNQATMIMIDLDNFKLANDQHGHLFGDALLIEVGSELKKLFRPDDIVARIGGDEFLIFTQLYAEPAVSNRVARIVENLRAKFRELIPDCAVSCSAGIVSCPKDGEDFQTLFHRCDQALYRAKEQGKDRFVRYSRTDVQSMPKLEARMRATTGTAIESDDIPVSSSDSIVQSALQAMHGTGDILLAINDILEMIGNKFNVSRTYILESSEDGQYCSNTFEWCNAGVPSEKDRLQHVPYESPEGNYQDNFDENGIFYCPDIKTLPKEQYNTMASRGVRSMLQCSIVNEGKFVGYVGFDDCEETRLWTQNQIDTLTFVSELLSAFLLKRRAQDKAAALADNLRDVLDHQNSWIYIMDPDTFELIFINKKTYQIVPDVKLGMRCHEVFFKRSQPCEQCPARNIREDTKQTLEIYNPVLNVWTLADSALLRWQDKEVCLVTCHDITRYKQEQLLHAPSSQP